MARTQIDWGSEYIGSMPISENFRQAKEEVKQGKHDGEFDCTVADMNFSEGNWPNDVEAAKNTIFLTVSKAVADILNADFILDDCSKNFDAIVEYHVEDIDDDKEREEKKTEFRKDLEKWHKKEVKGITKSAKNNVKSFLSFIKKRTGEGEEQKPEVLSESTAEQLKEAEVKPGQAMMSGEPTNPDSPAITEATSEAVTNSQQEQSTQTASNVFASGLGVVSQSASVASGAMIAAIATPNIVMDAVTYLQNSLMEHVSTSLVKILTPPTSKVLSYIQEYTLDNFPPNPNEILNKLMKGAEEFNQAIMESASEGLTQALTSEASEKMGAATKKVNSALSKAQEKIKTVAEKVQKGPAWVDKESKKIVDTVYEETTEFIDKFVDDFEKKKQKWAEDMGTKIANKDLKPKIQKVLDAQKKALEKIEEAKKKAIAAAKAAIAQALMKLKGLLGG